MDSLQMAKLAAVKADYSNLISFVPANASPVQERKHQQSIDPQRKYPPLIGSHVKHFYETVISGTSSCQSDLRTCLEADSNLSGMAVNKQRTQIKKANSRTKLPVKTVKQECKEIVDSSEKKTELIRSKSIMDETSNSTRSINSAAEMHYNISEKQKIEFLKNAEQGDEMKVRRDLEKGISVDTRDQFGWTALMCACYAGQTSVVTTLLEYGANKELHDSKGRNAKMLALKAGHKHFTALLSHSDCPETACDDKISETASYFCETCKLSVSGDKLSHITSTVHLFNQNKKSSVPCYFLPSGNKGYQLMVKQGWNKDQGLGSGGQGQKFPVKTVLKRDRKGLGCGEPDKPKVIHFCSKDVTAVQSVHLPLSVRKMSAKTLSKRASTAKERRDRAWERRIRYYFSSD